MEVGSDTINDTPVIYYQRNGMRILVINNLYPPQELGGYGRLLFDFAQLLEARGHTIRVLTSNTPYLGVITADEPNVGRDLLLFGEWRDGETRLLDEEKITAYLWHNCNALSRTIQEFSPEVCLLGNIDFIGVLLLNDLLARSIPVLHHLGNQYPGYDVASTPRSKLYRLACASGWLRDYIINLGYTFDTVDVIYPGARVDYFHNSGDLPFDKLRIAFAGLVLPFKGIHVLLKALLHLHQHHIDFTATIAGATTDPNFVRELQGVCAKAGMEQAVHFTGYLDREGLRRMYRQHNVMVFPSLVNEAFGISQVEAMASGLLVFSSATGGAAEIVSHQETGIVFASGDCFALSSNLSYVCNHQEVWNRLRLNGQKKALDTFDIRCSVDAIERIFEELLSSVMRVPG